MLRGQVLSRLSREFRDDWDLLRAPQGLRVQPVMYRWALKWRIQSIYLNQPAEPASGRRVEEDQRPVCGILDQHRLKL